MAISLADRNKSSLTPFVSWVEVEGFPSDPRFQHYPDMSLAEWHEAHGFRKEE